MWYWLDQRTTEIEKPTEVHDFNDKCEQSSKNWLLDHWDWNALFWGTPFWETSEWNAKPTKSKSKTMCYFVDAVVEYLNIAACRMPAWHFHSTCLWSPMITPKRCWSWPPMFLFILWLLILFDSHWWSTHVCYLTHVHPSGNPWLLIRQPGKQPRNVKALSLQWN